MIQRCVAHKCIHYVHHYALVITEFTDSHFTNDGRVSFRSCACRHAQEASRSLQGSLPQ